MTESTKRRGNSSGAHGPDCGCGIDVAGVTRLLDAEAVATHLGVHRGTLRSAQSRFERDKTHPWWRQPLPEMLAGAHIWDRDAAEEMRVAYANARSTTAG